ncbi:MAG: long-chain fatty acid--CoA ligase [Parachlamydiaceae bacterium]
MEKLYTCSDILCCLENGAPNPKAFNDRSGEGWQSMSTQSFLESVRFVALGLCSVGMGSGDRVGIYTNPSIQWTIADLAIMVGGGVSVPLFVNIAEDNFVYQVTETQLTLIFIEGVDQWDLFRRHESLIKTAIAVGEIPHDLRNKAKIIPFSDLVERGRQLDHSQPKLYQQLREALQSSDLGAIIYTSGSTGVPKGVELTHGNLTCVLNFSKFHWDIKKDRYLSVLPLAHVFGHCINLWVIAWGASVYYSNDYKNLGAICREVKPTAIVVVPRLLEKVYLRMIEQIHTAHGIRKSIGEWALKLARKEHPSFLEKMLKPIADLLLFRKLRRALGGKIRIVISGGAALSPHLQRFFDTIGVPIYEGWGLTEACPVCVNVPGQKKVGSVGLPLHDQTVAISPHGEILIKGTLVTSGYYKHPELTGATFDRDGWFRTGDRGSIDRDGFLTISGRIKELYKTSTGEYVAPVPIEQAIGHYPLIEMSMIVADGRKFTSCLLFPNLEMLARIKSQKDAEGTSNEAFLQSDYIRGEIDKLLGEVNKHLNHWEQVHAYRFILDPLTVQTGELTPSMKIRREVVAKKYKRLIDEMYHEEIE